MTKIHVVVRMRVSVEHWGEVTINSVYTNKKLAQKEVNYFNLKAIRQGWKTMYYIETYNISQIDWSEDYNKLLEELPY